MNKNLYKKIQIFINKINFIENNFHEKDFLVNDINVWPLIRLDFFKKVGSNIKENRNLKLKKNILNRIRNLIRSIVLSYKYKRKLNDYKTKHIENIFFSDKKFYYDKYNDKYINNLIDPYYFYLQKKKKLKIEIINSSLPLKQKFFEPFYVNLYSLLVFYILFSRINFISNILLKNKINKHLKNIEKKYSIKVDKNEIFRNLQTIKIQSIGFEIILKYIMPKRVYISCYYSLENFSIIFACNKLGIECVDIQHGGIENYHLMYSNWNYKNIKKHNLLPSKYIIWDKRPIDNSTLPNNKSKNFYVQGKLNIKFWEKHKKNSDEVSGINTIHFLSNIKKFKKVILTCITSELPSALIPLINSMPKNYFWLIRAHPRHSNLKILNKKLNKFVKKGKNFDIDQASKLNLNFLLSLSDKFLTDYSSTIYDADFYKIPKLALQTPNSLFTSWQKNNFCIFSTNLSKIKKFIKK